MTYTDGAKTETCEGSYSFTRTWRVVDACGNVSVSDSVQTITVLDTIRPQLSGTMDTLTVDGCAATDVPAAYTTAAEMEAVNAVVSDNCTADADLTITFSDVNAGSCPIIVTRTYTVTDDCGNSNTIEQIIRVQDTTRPAVSGALAAVTVDGCSLADAPTPYSSVAELNTAGAGIADNCSAEDMMVLTAVDDVESGSCPIEVIRTYTFADLCGNSNTISQTIYIQDTTRPVLGGTMDALTVDGSSASDVPAAYTTAAEMMAVHAIVNDDCTPSNQLAISYSDSFSGSCPIVATRTYTVTDLCGNSNTISQTIYIQDTTRPALSGTMDELTVDGCAVTDVPAGYTTVAEMEAVHAVVSDNCNANDQLTVTYSDAAAGTCPIVVTRTYTVTDVCGNSNTITQTINVQDTTRPVVTGVMDTLVIDGCSLLDLPDFYMTVAELEHDHAVISDNCTEDANLTVNSSDAISGTCPITIKRTYIVLDQCYNYDTISQIILIQDTTKPAVTPTEIEYATLGCVNDTVAPATSVADLQTMGFGISDNCVDLNFDGVVSRTVTGNACDGMVTTVYRVSDGCGNYTDMTLRQPYKDTIVPAFVGTWPSDIDNQNNCMATADVSGLMSDATVASLYEDCSTVIVSHDDDTVGNNCGWTITRTYTIADSCGNAVVRTMSVSGSDQTAPVIAAIPAQAAEAAHSGCQYRIPNVEMQTLMASSDNCGNAVTFVSQSPVAGTLIDQTSEIQTVVVTVTVKDECGNMQSSTVNVTVPADNIHLTVTDSVEICRGGSVSLTAVGGSDQGGVTYLWTPAVGLNVNTGNNVTASPDTTTTYTVIVTDANGCSLTGTTTVTVNPLVELSADSLVQHVCAGGAIEPIVVNYNHCTIEVSPLPDGLTFDAGTATISGHPHEEGSFTVIATSLYGCAGDTLRGAITLADTIMVFDTVSYCDSYTWYANGQTYTTSGRYRFGTQTAQECDSVMYLNLTMRYQTYGSENVTVCDTYTWNSGNGETYTLDTVVDHVFPNGNAVGCDSTVTLNLIVRHKSDTTLTVSACDHYEWYDSVYTVSTTDTNIIENMWSCDSVMALVLTINPVYHFDEYDTLCYGTTYHYHDMDITEEGSYSRGYLTQAGCDSVYTIHLTAADHIVIELEAIANCQTGQYAIVAHCGTPYFVWSSTTDYGQLVGQIHNDTIYVAPPDTATYILTAGYGEAMSCPESESITVEELLIPNARISYSPRRITSGEPHWTADDVSDNGAIDRIWYVDSVVYLYQGAHIEGDYYDDLDEEQKDLHLMLVSFSKFCSDTAYATVPFLRDPLFVPNIFTPGESTNNLFKPMGQGIADYEISIYNREGLLVFRSKDVNEYWDGTHHKTGMKCPQGAYTYRITYRYGNTSEKQTKIGTVTLLR